MHSGSRGITGIAGDRQGYCGTASGAIAALHLFLQDTHGNELARQARHDPTVNIQALGQFRTRARSAATQIPDDAFLVW
jgi:hypothetical protein